MIGISHSLFFYFFTALSTVFLHFYVWRRMVKDNYWPESVRTPLTNLLAIGCGGLLIFRLAAFFIKHQIMGFVIVTFYTWLAFAFFNFLLFFSYDLLNFVIQRVRQILRPEEFIDPITKTKYGLLFQEHNANPRGPALLQNRVFSVVILFLASVWFAFGVHQGLSEPVLTQTETVLPKLGHRFDGFQAVQISDLHIGPLVRLQQVQSIVSRVNALEPDVIFLTGDLVDGQVKDLKETASELAKLSAPYGVIFVPGNHEYQFDFEAWFKQLEHFGFAVLRNSAVNISRGNSTLCIAGIDDWESEHYCKSCKPDVSRAAQQCRPTSTRILLSHQPRALTEAQAENFDLVFAGHTHGGQIWPFGMFLRFFQPVIKGWSELGATKIFVSTGVAGWGPAVRVGAQPEFVIHKLKSGAAPEKEAVSGKNVNGSESILKIESLTKSGRKKSDRL